MSKKLLEQDEKQQKRHEQELELIERIRAGDVDAFGILVVRYQNRLIQFLSRRYGRQDVLVEDVAQNVFVLAYQKLDQYKGNSRFYTWLCTIGIRQMINAIQAQARKPTLTLESDLDEDNISSYTDLIDETSHSVEDLLIAEESQRKIQALIDQIPDKLIIPLNLSIYEELSYTEIAEKLNISVDSVRSRINRARTHFKRLLEKNNTEI